MKILSALKVDSCKDLIPTSDYLSKGWSKYGWANTPRIDVNRIKILARCDVKTVAERVSAGPGGDTSNLRSELGKYYLSWPTLGKHENFNLSQTSIISFRRR
jgi:hypothetical protein